MSKVHAVVGTNGLPVHLALTPGEAHDNRLCSVLLSDLLPQTMLLADRGYDADTSRYPLTITPSFLIFLSTRALGARYYLSLLPRHRR
jgi:transposase